MSLVSTYTSCYTLSVKLLNLEVDSGSLRPQAQRETSNPTNLTGRVQSSTLKCLMQPSTHIKANNSTMIVAALSKSVGEAQLSLISV